MKNIYNINSLSINKNEWDSLDIKLRILNSYKGLKILYLIIFNKILIYNM